MFAILLPADIWSITLRFQQNDVTPFQPQRPASAFDPFPHSVSTTEMNCNIATLNVTASEERRNNWLLILRYNEKRTIGWFWQSEVIVSHPLQACV